MEMLKNSTEPNNVKWPISIGECLINKYRVCLLFKQQPFGCGTRIYTPQNVGLRLNRLLGYKTIKTSFPFWSSKRSKTISGNFQGFFFHDSYYFRKREREKTRADVTVKEKNRHSLIDMHCSWCMME